jgi:hypothetical protein
MTDISITNLRPKNATAGALREALALVRDERAAARQRLAEETERLPGLLLTATNAAVRSAEQAIRDDDLNVSRLNALEAELSRKLTETAAIEAGERRAQQVRDAAAKIEAFNSWLATDYTKHAEAIAAGCELERQASRAIDALRNPTTRAVPDDLPDLARGWVGPTQSRGFGFLCRLPAAAPGTPIVWP